MSALSPRLAAIGNEIRNGETMADIGTDHGLLPAYLLENEICPVAILTDISSGSLEKARANCSRLCPGRCFDLRLGDGLSVIEEGETDVAVMAGMGGILISEMIEADLQKSRSFKRLILQPRNNAGVLRFSLYNSGFSIINEQLAREGRFICEIITAIPKEVAVIRSMGPERVEYQFPQSLIKYKGPLTEEYLTGKRAAEEKILREISKSKTISKSEIRSRQYRIDYLTWLLAKCRNEKGDQG